MPRAAIYLRISYDRTGEELGVTRQRQDCEALAQQAGWEVVEVFTDNDVSATSSKPRPEYRRMLRAIEAGEVDAIVAWAPDRIYRRLPDLEELIEIVERHGTAIRTCRAGDFDLGTPLGKMIGRILGAVATGEGDVRTDRWKRSVLQRREAGTFPASGPRMYGWTREGHKIRAEADNIALMADHITGGGSMNGLAKLLHERGITSTSGNVFSTAALRKLLLNPKLAGYATLNGEIIGTGQWEPILDPADWDAVRAALTANTAPTRRTRVALLPGLIFCGGCGSPMVTGSRMTKLHTTLRTYRCTREPGRGGCQKVSGRADRIEEIVEGIARKVLAQPRARIRIEQLRAQPAPSQEELAGLQIRIQELEQKLAEPGVPVETLLRAIDRAKRQQGDLLADLATHAVVSIPTDEDPWPTDLRQRRALVELAIERVILSPASRVGVFDADRVLVTPR